MISKPLNETYRPTILIIDDDAHIITLITDVLKHDYTLKALTDATKVMAFVERHPRIDLILLDVMMPQIDGYALCKQLKESPQATAIPIIFLTALESDEEIVKGLRLGAVDYITKPFNIEVLKARVQTHLQLKRFSDSLLEIIEEKEELLIKQSKMATLGEMFENIAHQWKQPLSIISMACNDMEVDHALGTFSAEEAMHQIEVIRRALAQQVTAIDTFRDFIKYTHKPTRFALAALIEECRIFISSKLNAQQIAFDAAIPSELYLHADRSALLQILLNLFSNSIDALHRRTEHRWMHVTCKQEQQTLRIALCDNGGGIHEPHAQKVFEKYYTTKGDSEGSGLGLYMSREIVIKKLHGSLDFHNTDEGVCFVLTLPNHAQEL